MRLPIALFFAVLASGAAADAANLIENPHFDDDTSEWGALLGSTIAHDDADERGSLLSGSIEVTDAFAGNNLFGAYQCVPVVAGKTYAYGASVRIPQGQPVGSVVGSVLINGWSTSPICSPIDIFNVPAGTALNVSVRGAWGPTQNWATAPPGAQAAYFWLLGSSSFDGARLLFDNVFFLEDETCGASITTLCLNDGRFRVAVEWETNQGLQGFGKAVDLTDDSGYFWFFNSDNIELVTKLLDACPTQFHTYWFFAAGLTNVETVIRVHDTGTDTEQVYTNPQETPFAPIQDTNAFATCP
ncbi:MAG TPA: hypothetical protein VHR17_05595 [Thermoanaerobaculia bacterium]|nr:hypothetical protein [Thermoanaerobaculia bacterium]